MNSNKTKKSLLEAKRAMETLGMSAHNRDTLRESGITLQLFKTLSMIHTQKRNDLLETLNGPEVQIEGGGNTRMMVFGEYHHWPYERVMRGNQIMWHI